MNPEGCVVLSTDEATKVALEQIKVLTDSILNEDDGLKNVVAFADIMELIHLVFKNKNIDPNHLFSALEELKNTQGTFDQKIAIQEQ